MLLLLKLIPFRDYLYAAAAIAAVSWYNVHVHGLTTAAVAHERAAVAAETAKVEKDAAARVATLTKDHDDRVAQIEANYEQTIQADDAAHAADLRRLRVVAAQGSSRPAVGGTASPSAPPDPGLPSLVGLGYVSAELASALRDARDDLGACYAERDSLTGK